MMIVGCDNLTNTDHSAIKQVENRTVLNGLFSSSITDTYNATVLPGKGFTSSARLIADNDNVFGALDENYQKAVKWSIASDGVVSDPVYLGKLPEPWHEFDQHVHGVNNTGDIVVGWAGRFDDIPGWVWANGEMKLLPVPEYTIKVWPTYVSGEGLIVGSLDLNNGEWQRYGAVWFPPYDTAPILLPVVEDYEITTARAIDSQGKVMGWARASGLPDILVQWQIDSEGNVLSGPDKIDGIEDILFIGANQSLDIVGMSHPAIEPYLFKSDSWQKIELGLLEGEHSGFASGLNERKQDGSVQVVGRSSPESSLPLENLSAVLWSVDANNTVTGPVDLGLPDRVQISTRPPRYLEFVSASAYSISNKNWVAGTSTREDGKEFATIWLPSTDNGDDGNDGDDPAPPSGDLTASFDYSCGNSDTCTFTDTSTGDDIVSRDWDPAGIADDGKYTFSAGEHTITLTISDSSGNSSSASETINCRSHPRHGVRCS